MKTINVEPHIRKTLADLDTEIKVRQDDLKQLIDCRTTLCEMHEIPVELPLGNLKSEPAPAARPSRPSTPALDIKGKPGRKPKTPAGPSTAAIIAEKPDTLAGAMKACARKLGKFTKESLIAELDADADFKELRANAGASSLDGNLAYWTKTGKLTKSDDTFTVVNLEF